MNRYRLAPSDTRDGQGDGLDILEAVDGGSEAVTQRVFFFPMPGAHHNKDAAGDSSFAQCYAFVGGSHAKPARAFLLECVGTNFSTVSVGIALHHRADDDGVANVLLQSAEIMAQRR